VPPEHGKRLERLAKGKQLLFFFVVNSAHILMYIFSYIILDIVIQAFSLEVHKTAKHFLDTR